MNALAPTVDQKAAQIIAQLSRECPGSPLDMNWSQKRAVRKVVLAALIQIEGNSTFGQFLECAKQADVVDRKDMFESDVDAAEQAADDLVHWAEELTDEYKGVMGR